MRPGVTDVTAGRIVQTGNSILYLCGLINKQASPSTQNICRRSYDARGSGGQCCTNGSSGTCTRHLLTYADHSAFRTHKAEVLMETAGRSDGDTGDPVGNDMRPGLSARSTSL